MATIETRVAACLAADADVSALVAERIYLGILPQDATLPALVYTIVPSARAGDLDGDAGACPGVNVQVDAYTTDPDQGTALHTFVRTALSRDLKATAGQPSQMPDPEEHRTRVTADYVVAHADSMS